MLPLIIIIAVLAIILIAMYFNYNNREVALRKEAAAQNDKITTVHDTMWKVLQQEAGVAKEYRDAFEKIYPELISGRYSNDKEGMMKFIHEANPDFDTSLYKQLMQSIEVQRGEFASAQQRMLDIIREHDTLLETMPAKWFIKDKRHIIYKVISSTRTNQVIETRVDDDVKLF